MRTLVIATIATVVGFATLASASIKCPTKVTQSGDNAANTLLGTPGADKITGIGGDDTIRGFAGNDCLNGGSQNDTIEGGDDNDKIAGEGGNDTISGGNGNDELNGGNNDDVIDGGPGDDKIAGEGGFDTITPGPGADKTNAGSKDDTIIIMAGDVPAGKTETIDGGVDVDTVKANFLITLTPPLTEAIDPVTGGKYVIKNVEIVALMPTTTTTVATTTSTTTTTTLVLCNGGTPDALDACTGACGAGEECGTHWDANTGTSSCVCITAPACRGATDANCPVGDRCTTSNLSSNLVCGELFCCTDGVSCAAVPFNGAALSCTGSAFAGAVCNLSQQCCDDDGGPCH